MKFSQLLVAQQVKLNLVRVRKGIRVEIGKAIKMTGNFSSVDIILHQGDVSLAGTIVFDLIADEFVKPATEEKAKRAILQMVNRLETGKDEVPAEVQAQADRTGVPAVYEYEPGMVIHVQPGKTVH